MSKILLEIKNLHAGVEGKEILKGIDLTIREGEVHAGPTAPARALSEVCLQGVPATKSRREASLSPAATFCP